MKLERKRTLDLWLGGLVLGVLRPLVAGLGVVLRRDHTLEVRGDVLVAKLQGGGSLVLALPALLGLKRGYADRKLVLVCTPAVAAYARLLGVFDELRVVDDRSAPRLVASGLRALGRAFRVDTFVDLEVYSRLSSAFCALTAARNRIGFYLESTFWRERLHTHLIFFGRHAGVYRFYERVAMLLGAEPASMEDCAASVRARLPAVAGADGAPYLCLGTTCSELGRERMLAPAMWRRVFDERFAATGCERVVLLGAEGDRAFAESVVEAVAPACPSARFEVRCGELSLGESVALLAGASRFWGIDSGLLHFARLLAVPTLSFWGPTAPATRLKDVPGLEEEVVYAPTPCSPCVHSAEIPPCRGDNRCIQRLFEDVPADEFVPVVGPAELER